MQHYGVNGYSLHAMNSLSAMYNLHQQAAQQAQHAPDYRPSVHALTLAERLAGKNQLLMFLRAHHLPANPNIFLCLLLRMGNVSTHLWLPKWPLTSIKLVVFLLSQRLHISRHYP